MTLPKIKTRLTFSDKHGVPQEFDFCNVKGNRAQFFRTRVGTVSVDLATMKPSRGYTVSPDTADQIRALATRDLTVVVYGTGFNPFVLHFARSDAQASHTALRAFLRQLVGERTTPFYGFDVALVDDDTGTFDDYGYIMAFPHYKYIDDKLVQIDRLRSEA